MWWLGVFWEWVDGCGGSVTTRLMEYPERSTLRAGSIHRITYGMFVLERGVADDESDEREVTFGLKSEPSSFPQWL